VSKDTRNNKQRQRQVTINKLWNLIKGKKKCTQWCEDGEMHYVEFDVSISRVNPFYKEHVGRCPWRFFCRWLGWQKHRGIQPLGNDTEQKKD